MKAIIGRSINEKSIIPLICEHSFKSYIKARGFLSQRRKNKYVFSKNNLESNFNLKFFKFNFSRFHEIEDDSNLSTEYDTEDLDTNFSQKKKFTIIKSKNPVMHFHNYDKIKINSDKLREIIIGDKNKFQNFFTDESFFICLQNYLNELTYVSQNNLKIIYERDKNIFTSIFNYFLNKEIKLTLPIQVFSITKFIYILERKKIYNLKRDENDAIIPQIKLYVTNNLNLFNINESLEIWMMLAYLGQTINIQLLKNKLAQEKDFSSIELFSIVMEGLLFSKNSNNSIYEYKNNLLALLLDPYIMYSSKQNFEKKTLSFKIVSKIYSDHYKNKRFFGVNLTQSETFIRDLIFEEGGLGSVKSLFSVTNFLEGLVAIEKTGLVSDDLLKSALDGIYKYLLESIRNTMNMYLHGDTLKKNLNNSNHTNKDNQYGKFPVFFLIFKIISQFQSHLLPNQEFLDSVYDFVKIVHDFHENKHTFKVNEITYLLVLMRKKNYYSQETCKIITTYIIMNIPYLKVNYIPLDDFIFFLRKEDDFDKKIYHILKSLEKFSYDDVSFRSLFWILNKICFFEKHINRKENLTLFDLVFAKISTKLKLIPHNEITRQIFHIMPEYLDYEHNYFQEINKLKIVNLILFFIEQDIQGKDESSLYICKKFVYLNEIKFHNQGEEYLKINEKIDSMVQKFVNNYKVILKRSLMYSLRIFQLNKSVIITIKTFKAINFFLEADKQILNSENIYNLTKFLEIYDLNNTSSDERLKIEIEKLKKYKLKKLYVPKKTIEP
jgi:hypothetical protein